MRENNNHVLPKEDDFWLKAIDAGSWQLNQGEGEVHWSPGFLELLGLSFDDAQFSFRYFINNLVHPGDRSQVEKAVMFLLENEDRTDMEVRLLHQTKKYCWFRMILVSEYRSPPYLVHGCILEIEYVKALELRVSRLEKRLIDAGEIGDFGTWEVDLRRMEINWSGNMYHLLSLSSGFPLNLDTTVALFHPSSISEFSEAFTDAAKKGKPFDLDLRMNTGNKETIWVRCACEPVREKGKIVRLKGILQNIDEMKKREIHLHRLNEALAERNDRLLNFAYIVSHNLRNHSGNLQMIMDFVKESTSEAEKLSFLEDLYSVSDSLSKTIHHLTEITQLQTSPDKLRKEINFHDLLQSIKDSLSLKITGAHAIIKHDFSEMPIIHTVPAYMESILTNLLSNAIKYRYPDRTPVIEISTSCEDRKQIIIVKDNGVGIDLNRHGDKLFGMYKTFHNHQDSRGIGLFITKNQIEAMGGKIEVKSVVNRGTEFKITFEDTPDMARIH